MRLFKPGAWNSEKAENLQRAENADQALNVFAIGPRTPAFPTPPPSQHPLHRAQNLQCEDEGQLQVHQWRFDALFSQASNSENVRTVLGTQAASEDWGVFSPRITPPTRRFGHPEYSASSHSK
ncbi:hypothetical protein BDV93DRAFT_559961 [Ceratobasidium sp. AG-I]|nr:hypothetical protein BDV93DRAFT_559961 [Ceratobasidium sp. AG-I]